MATTRKREYVFTPDGAILRREIAESEIDVTDDLVSKLSRDQCLKQPRITEIPGVGDVGLTLIGKLCYWTINLSRIKIRAPWRMIRDNSLLTPNFGSRTDPIIEVAWRPPKNLFWVKLLVATSLYEERHASRFLASGAWLFAQSDNGAVYRMPLANVHDDCAVCTGSAVYGPTQLQVMLSQLENFDQSIYNADLWDSTEKTERFFRVQPSKEKDEPFLSLAPEGDWTSLCTKVGSAINTYII